MNFEAHNASQESTSQPQSERESCVTLRVANDEAKDIEKKLIDSIQLSVNLDNDEKKMLFDGVNKILGDTKDKYIDALKQIDVQNRDLCLAEVKKIQAEYLRLVTEFSKGLDTAFDDAIGLSFHMSDDEFAEIYNGLALLVPIDIRGVTPEERANWGKQRSDFSRTMDEVPQFVADTTTEFASTILMPAGAEEALALLKAGTVDAVDRAAAREKLIAAGVQGEELEKMLDGVAKPFTQSLKENWAGTLFFFVSLLPVGKVAGKVGGKLMLLPDKELAVVLKELGGAAWDAIVSNGCMKIALSTIKSFLQARVKDELVQ